MFTIFGIFIISKHFPINILLFPWRPSVHSHYFVGYLDSQIHKFKNSVFGICVCTTQKCQINQFFSLTAPSNGSLLTLIAVLTLPTHKIFHKPNGTPSTVFDNFEPKHQTISSSWKTILFLDLKETFVPLRQSLSSDGAKFSSTPRFWKQAKVFH